ncbi:MAG: hypothetical protein CL950_13330 [Erythrobacter sp.]|nr:hypothetical protein A3745_08145 [Erythrobacter sp. HI0074]KZZ09136.1 hypothetical protein A3748_09195 [Erythrobacter sp. HI0077]MAQ30919.1 hypothetical protein [Erythrobacter sp.]
MLIAALIQHFDAYTELHVDVNNVRDKLVELGVEDEITFHFPKMEPGRIRGLLDRWERPSGVYSADPTLVADIIIAADMGEETEYWQRLVAVKELLHLADCADLSAESAEAVNVLFRNFALPPELRYGKKPLTTNTNSYLNDETRFYLALAVLVPLGCRVPLRQLYKAERLRAAEIADLAKIPERFIPEVMGDHFDLVIENFLAWEEDTIANGHGK